jgi:5-methylcytosine-specific restriction protein A
MPDLALTPDQERARDAHRREASPWRAWYGRKAWLQLRTWRLGVEPLCRFCKGLGRVTPANTVDHVREHKGVWDLFIDPENTQSLCKACHDGRKQQMERIGYDATVGEDGWPVDDAHPAMGVGGGQKSGGLTLPDPFSPSVQRGPKLEKKSHS